MIILCFLFVLSGYFSSSQHSLTLFLISGLAPSLLSSYGAAMIRTWR